MLYSFLKALMGESKKDVEAERKRKKKLTPKEKSELEYKLWVMAEEYEEEE